MPYKDLEKRRLYRRKWYANNKESEKKYVSSRKNKIRTWLAECKCNLSCSKCGEKHPAIIDFHHKGKKESAIADMVNNGISIEKIKKEINECEVLCANCHRKLHWNKTTKLKNQKAIQ